MSVNRKDGTQAAKAFAQVAQDYIESGTTPATCAVAMVSEGAAMVAHLTSHAGAAKMLRRVADSVERGGPIKGAASRPATPAETMTIARTAIDALAAEFIALAKKSAKLIEKKKSAEARRLLLAAAAKFGGLSPNKG